VQLLRVISPIDPTQAGESAETNGRHRMLLFTRQEAADSLGMSLSHFQRHVQPYVPCVYSGQLRLYRPHDLERWAEANLLKVVRAEPGG
jgi:hypothetical protein